MLRLRPVPPGLAAALVSDDWFGSLAPALRDEMLRLAHVRLLDAQAPLFARGDTADGLYCVIAGALRIGTHCEQGELALVARLEPYQWFGEVSLIDGRPRTHDAFADEDAQLLVVPHDGLCRWLDEHPAAWREFGRLACTKLRAAFTALEEQAQLPLDERLWRRLTMVARGYGSRGVPRRRVRLGQEALAQMLGVSRQSVNKALRSLQAQGRVRLHYGEVELLGPPGR